MMIDHHAGAFEPNKRMAAFGDHARADERRQLGRQRFFRFRSKLA
jgi:hypothetical protein